jgi:hypothetical protein
MLFCKIPNQSPQSLNFRSVTRRTSPSTNPVAFGSNPYTLYGFGYGIQKLGTKPRLLFLVKVAAASISRRAILPKTTVFTREQ